MHFFFEWLVVLFVCVLDRAIFKARQIWQMYSYFWSLARKRKTDGTVVWMQRAKATTVVRETRYTFFNISHLLSISCRKSGGHVVNATVYIEKVLFQTPVEPSLAVWERHWPLLAPYILSIASNFFKNLNSS